MSTDRILLSQDNTLKARIIGDITKFNKTFEAVKDTFEQLQIGNLTNDIYTTIAEGKSATLRGNYIKSVEDQLIKSGVTNSVLKGIAMQGTDDLFNNFVSAAKGFVNTDLTPPQYGLDKDRRHFLNIGDISYSFDTGLHITEKQEEGILERCCRLYAATATEKEIYHALKALTPALQNYLVVLKKAGIPFYEMEFMDGRKGYMSNSYIENFFTCETSMVVNIIPGMIPWAAGYKAEQERRNQRGY